MTHSLDSLVRFGIAPLGPFIMDQLSISKGAFGLLSSAIRVSGIPLAVAAGMLVDRIGIRRAMATVGVAVTVVLSLFLLPLAYWSAFVLFSATGAAIALVSPLGNAGIMRWFPVRERGLAFGLKQMGVPLGGALTALVLPPAALRWGWQAAFAALGVVVGATALGASLVYRDPPGEAETTVTSDEIVTSTDRKVSALTVLRTPGVALLIMMGSSFAAVQTSFLTFAVPFLQDTGLSVVAAGAYLSLSQVAGMVGRPTAGVVSDRLLRGRRKGVLIGLVVMVVASLSFMALMGPKLGPLLLGCTVALVGASTMAWAGVFFAGTLERADVTALGTASGVASTANMTGSLLGVPLFGFMADATSFTSAFLVFAGWLCVAGLLFIAFFRELPLSERT